VDTAMVAAIPDKVKEKILAGIPAARLAQPEEIAAAVPYLASPAAGYGTGQVLPVNGGARMCDRRRAAVPGNLPGPGLLPNPSDPQLGRSASWPRRPRRPPAGPPVRGAADDALGQEHDDQ